MQIIKFNETKDTFDINTGFKTIEVFEWREHHYDNTHFVTMTGKEGETIMLPPFDFPITTQPLFETAYNF
jgi:hypothetical protein